MREGFSDAEEMRSREISPTFPSIVNTAGEREREARSRRANALDAFGVVCGVLFVLWPFCFGGAILGHAHWVNAAARAAMLGGFGWAVIGSPRWHGDTLESLGLGSPHRLWRLIRSRSGADRGRLIAVFLAVLGGIVWFSLADWPDAARFFRLPKPYRVSPASAGEWAALSLLATAAAALLATCVIRYDNLGSAFGLALKISALYLAFGALAAWTALGEKAFAKFTLVDHTLDVAAHIFWGLIQQLTFTAFFATRLRKAFGPATSSANFIAPEKRALAVSLGAIIAAATLGPAVWLALHLANGAQVSLSSLAGCAAFALPAGAVWTHFFCRDKKRLLVATLSGSFFGIIHIDSYGLVLLTTILGTTFAYAAMEDRFRNLAAFACMHGLLGATIVKMFSGKGVWQISLSVGPWAVQRPTASVLIFPLIALATYAALAWRVSRRREG
jgi:hypothetical protein